MAEIPSNSTSGALYFRTIEISQGTTWPCPSIVASARSGSKAAPDWLSRILFDICDSNKAGSDLLCDPWCPRNLSHCYHKLVFLVNSSLYFLPLNSTRIMPNTSMRQFTNVTIWNTRVSPDPSCTGIIITLHSTIRTTTLIASIDKTTRGWCWTSEVWSLRFNDLPDTR